MPSFQDSAVIFFLALLLFGPKKLPELARYVGKLMAEFRRASNEFRSQMEEELRVADQAEQQKKIAAIEAAAPVAPIIAQDIPEPEHPHLDPVLLPTEDSPAEQSVFVAEDGAENRIDPRIAKAVSEIPVGEASPEPLSPLPAPLPIATSGDLNLMPPATGLPAARSSFPNGTSNGQSATESNSHGDSLSGLFDSIPQTPDPAAPENEPSTHV